MPRYRIRVDRLDVVADTQAKWMRNAGPDGADGYVHPPEGTTKEVNETVFDQTVDDLNLAGMVRAINTPDAFKA